MVNPSLTASKPSVAGFSRFVRDTLTYLRYPLPKPLSSGEGLTIAPLKKLAAGE